MKTSLEERIKNANLTKAEKRIAEHILKNYLNICFKTVMDVAEEVGVSDTSVIRLTRKLEFDGYTDMQNFIKASMQREMEKNGGLQSLPPAERLLKKINDIQADDLYERMIEKTFDNLESVFTRNETETMEKASEFIIASKRKFVVGFRGSSGVADLVGGCLGDILEDVRTITQADSKVIEALMDITAEDCLILISVPRYPNMAQTAIEIAKEANAKIIVLTDKFTAPVAKDADLVLLAGIEGVTHNNSYVALSFLGEVIVANTVKLLGASVNPRLEKLEKYIAENVLF